MIQQTTQDCTLNDVDRYSPDKSSNISTTTIVVIPQHRDPQPVTNVPRENSACRVCGHIGQHVIEPGCGPHPYKLICEMCERFIRWVSAKSPAEHEQAAARYRDERLASQLPTERQVSYLHSLGYRGEPPQSKLEASKLIDDLKGRRYR